MRACTTAFLTSYWSLPQELQIAEGEDKLMWEALKWEREGRVEAWERRRLDQWQVIFYLISRPHSNLDGVMARM